MPFLSNIKNRNRLLRAVLLAALVYLPQGVDAPHCRGLLIDVIVFDELVAHVLIRSRFFESKF